MKRIKELEQEIAELRQQIRDCLGLLAILPDVEIQTRKKLNTSRILFTLSYLTMAFVGKMLVLSNIMSSFFQVGIYTITSISYIVGMKYTNTKEEKVLQECANRHIEIMDLMERADKLIKEAEKELTQLKSIDEEMKINNIETNKDYTKEQLIVLKKYYRTIFDPFLKAGFFMNDIFDFISECTEEECETVGTMLQMNIIPLSDLYDNYTLYEEPILLIQEERPENMAQEDYLRYCRRQCLLFMKEKEKREAQKELNK